MLHQASKTETPEALGLTLDRMMNDLAGDISVIGQQIAEPSRLDAAVVKRALGRIVQLSHQFVQFIPRVSAARRAEIDAKGELSPGEEHRWGQLNTKVFTARTWVNTWPGIEALVRSQIPAQRRKLYVEVDPVKQAQDQAMDAAFAALQNMLNTASQDDEARDHGCFADISLSHSTFTAHLQAAHRVVLAQNRRHPPRFLDVGCGGGVKVLAARYFFERADGLEYDPGYVAAAEDLIVRSGTGGCQIIHADGLRFEGYGQYDVIYFYRPMRDMDQLRELESQILRHAQSGTLIIAPYKMFEYRYHELGCAHLADHLYVLGMSQDDADELRRRAEFVGTASSLKPARAPSMWDPILDASLQNGYVP